MGKAAGCWLREQELEDGVQVIVIVACDHNIISASTPLWSTVTQSQSLPLIRGPRVCTTTKFIGLLSGGPAKTLCNANICFYGPESIGSITNYE